MIWRIVLFVCFVSTLVLGYKSCTKKDDLTAVCQKACYPNPVDRVTGKQCFCKADIVIREMPNEEVPSSR